jgi:tape measure domain-containing protein
MQATDLKVRVGFLFDEKSLNALSKRLQRSGEQLSRIGTDLTLSLSAPLAAFGAASIKAAGDIESLTLALKSQLGSSEAAAAELDKLTEAAKNPGLGVEQAVRGSVRLQGVGLAADEARETLIQMGNAIAATGGTAQELDNVTRQFAQMISKGRVLQEDVSILSENMPGLAQLMQKAFGTQSVEAIREMGVGGKEFVQRITEAAKELPRVEGGIKNGIGNAMDSLKQSAAKVGLAINTAFDVTGLIESFSGGLLAAANAFSSLDSGVQKLILSLAGIVIATGPVVSAFGAIKQFAGTFVSIWANVLSSVKAGITAFKALDTAMKLTVIGGLIAAVGLLAAAYTHFSSQLTDAERAQKSLSEVNRKAAESVAGQKSEVDTLVAAYKSEGATLDQKKEILRKLNQISPEYFGGLRVGKGDVDKLTEATKRYGAELLKVAELNSLNKRLEAIATDLRNVGEAAKPSTFQTIVNGALSAGNAFLFAANQTGTFVENSNALKTSLLAEQDALQKRATELALSAAATGNLADEYKDLGGASDEAKAAAKALSKAIKEVFSDVANAPNIAQAIGDDADLETIKALKSGIRKLIDLGLKPASTEVLALKTQLDALNSSVVSVDVIKREGNIPGVVSQNPTATPEVNPVVPPENIDASVAAFTRYTDAIGLAYEAQKSLEAGTFNFITGLDEVSAGLLENGNLIAGIFASMGNAIAQAAAQGETSFAKLGQAAAGAAAKIIRAYIQQGVAAAVAKALSSVPFPLNIAAGAAAGGIAAALFTRAVGAIGIKGFARGTGYAPGGMALVGEQGPELINLPRGSQVYSNPKTNRMLDSMGGGGMLNGEFTVRGTDLVLVLERAQNKNQRFR